MKIFVSGATGYIGEKLCMKLADNGNIIHALFRNPEKTKAIQHRNIMLFKGDITDNESIKIGMKGCDQVYHVAAFTEVWTKKKESIYELNVKATEIMLKQALNLGVKKFVFTSTAGVFGPSINGTINEETQRSLPYFLEYERTKAIAEIKVKEYVAKGLNCVIVNPTRVYGPGLLSKSNSVTLMINQYLNGKWRIIPGNGKSVGNYVYVDDVVNGHILAMEKGTSGQCYILGGSNISYLEFFEQLKIQTGHKHFMIKLPLFVMICISNILMFNTKILGVKPLITPALVRKFNYDWIVSSEKAIKQLNYSPISLNEGLRKILDWLKSNRN